MPLYEYLCSDCDREVEVLVRSCDDKPACPECGGERLSKLLSVPSAPATTAGGGDSGPPAGPCGSACGCFPPGS